jgi:hypothetical protein
MPDAIGAVDRLPRAPGDNGIFGDLPGRNGGQNATALRNPGLIGAKWLCLRRMSSHGAIRDDHTFVLLTQRLAAERCLQLENGRFSIAVEMRRTRRRDFHES